MRSLISICLVMAGGLVGASCVATRPVHYYTIQPASPASNQAKPDGLILLVGAIALRKPCRTAGSVIGPDPTKQALTNTIAGQSGQARWSATRWCGRCGPRASISA